MLTCIEISPCRAEILEGLAFFDDETIRPAFFASSSDTEFLITRGSDQTGVSRQGVGDRRAANVAHAAGIFCRAGDPRRRSHRQIRPVLPGCPIDGRARFRPVLPVSE